MSRATPAPVSRIKDKKPPQWRNWAGNVSDQARLVTPPSIDALVDVVRTAVANGERIRPAGSSHSFSDVARSDGLRISLAGLPQDVVVSGTAATVPAGMTLATLNRVLASHDLALPNLGDIDAQTVAGAIQTGTHGTGRRLGCLSTFVSQLTLVTASGSVVTCSRTSSPSLFAAAVVGLGAFGVITTVTLECVPAFVLRAVERPDSLSSVLSSYESLVESNDHFEFFWFPYTSLVQTKTNNRVDVSDQPLPRWREWLDDSFLQNSVYGVACRVTQSVPSLGPALMKVGARALTARTYTAASYEAFCTPRRVRFHETEYGLPRAALPEAFAAVRSIIDSLPYKLIFPVEVRCAAGDDFWLSHGYGRDTVYVAVQQYVGMPYEELFRAFERVCLDLGGRPHWGKMTWATAAELRAAYPKWDDWAAERRKIDPGGTFGSTFVDRLFPEIVEDGKKT